MNESVHHAACEALAAGLAVVPPREDGSKRPLGEWKEYQLRLPTDDEISRWYATGRYGGLGLVCGAVSGGLECFEFEGVAVAEGVYDGFLEAVNAAGLADLWERIVAGYSERSPSGGLHFLWHCDEVDGNTKLAVRLKRPEEMSDAGDKWQTLIETRGEGGYIITAPTNGRVHKSGEAYVLERGGFGTITRVTPAERRLLLDIARTFDRSPSRPADGQRQREAASTDRPGDEFDKRADWVADVLRPAGYTLAERKRGADGRLTGEEWWRRPGKDEGHSVVLHRDSDVLVPFSTSTPFPEMERGYGKFAAFAWLFHGGDFRAAAQAARFLFLEIPRDRGTHETNPPLFRTARQIAGATPERPVWIARPWTVRGGITEVAGKVKSAGKTTWELAKCRAVLDGAPFLGEPTLQGPVVYLTEQPDASLRQALERADLLDRDDFYVLAKTDTRGMPWPDVVEAAAEKCRETGAVLLVVDTLSKFAGIKGDDENSSGAAMAAVEPLQSFAAEGTAGIDVIRHDRKGGGDVGESARGSSAFTGEVDIVLSIRRLDGDQPSVRVIRSLSRFDETPENTIIELTEEGYVLRGDEDGYKADRTRRALLAALPEPDEEAKQIEKICEAAEIKVHATTRGTLKDLVSSGLVERLGKGRRGDPYLYRKKLTATSEPCPDEMNSFHAQPQSQGFRETGNAITDDDLEDLTDVLDEGHP